MYPNNSSRRKPANLDPHLSGTEFHAPKRTKAIIRYPAELEKLGAKYGEDYSEGISRASAGDWDERKSEVPDAIQREALQTWIAKETVIGNMDGGGSSSLNNKAPV